MYVVYNNFKFITFLESFFTIRVSRKFNFFKIFLRLGFFFSFLKILKIYTNTFILFYFSHIINLSANILNDTNNFLQSTKFSFFLTANRYTWYLIWLRTLGFFTVKCLLPIKQSNKLRKIIIKKKLFYSNIWSYNIFQLKFLNKYFTTFKRLFFNYINKKHRYYKSVKINHKSYIKHNKWIAKINLINKKRFFKKHPKSHTNLIVKSKIRRYKYIFNKSDKLKYATTNISGNVYQKKLKNRKLFQHKRDRYLLLKFIKKTGKSNQIYLKTINKSYLIKVFNSVIIKKLRQYSKIKNLSISFLQRKLFNILVNFFYEFWYKKKNSKTYFLYTKLNKLNYLFSYLRYFFYFFFLVKPFLFFLKNFFYILYNRYFLVPTCVKFNKINILFIFRKRSDIFPELFIYLIIGKLQQYYKLPYIFQLVNNLCSFYVKKKVIRGFKILLSGRFSRKDRATYIWSEFKLPLNTKFSAISFGWRNIILKYSLCMLKIWICK